MLEHGRAIGWSLGTYLVLKMTLSTPERSFPLIPRLHPDLVIGIAKIDLCEEPGPMESVKHLMLGLLPLVTSAPIVSAP